LEAVSGKFDRQGDAMRLLLLQAEDGPATLGILIKILIMAWKFQAQLISL
jgi:hypothetical protein